MPFRQPQAVKELLDQQRRTGDPSLSTVEDRIRFYYIDIFNAHPCSNSTGHGKACGSYTENMRIALNRWVEEKAGSWAGFITFSYRLSRKREITVIGRYPYLQHNPNYGSGKRGFVMWLRVDSIDGSPCKCKRECFAWNRIVGGENLLMLEDGHNRISGDV